MAQGKTTRKTIRPLLLAALATGAAGGLAVALAGFAFIKSGIYDVAAAKPHSKFTEWLTHETMIHSVRRHASGIVATPSASAAQVRHGFCEYETHCVACHGAPAVARERWVSGMEPSPPYLLDATQRFTPSELFWIARNGIKMTGMPAWRNSMSEAELWDVVAFMEARLDSQTYLQWRSAGVCAQLNGPPAPGPLSIPPRARARPTAATGE